MAIKSTSLFLILFCALLFGCTPVLHISKTDVQYTTVQSDQELTGDAAINDIIAPYKAEVDAEMNVVIGTVAKELTKRKPESTLGNFYIDAMLEGSRKEDPDVDFAIANYGGLRVPYVSSGPLTKRQLFELSPFDNMLVIVHIPGEVLELLMHHLAETGGWPVSQEVKMSINRGTLIDCTIKGEAISKSRIYKVAMPDYIADGGDGFKELIPLDRTQSGNLVRDVIIEYVIDLTEKGGKVDGEIEGRVVNVK